MTRLGHLGLTVSLLGSLACDFAAAEPAPMPAGFSVTPRGASVRGLYMRAVTHQGPLTIRADTEAVCEGARMTGLTTKHPRFEDGIDGPYRGETVSYFTDAVNATYTTQYVPACDGGSKLSAVFRCECLHKKKQLRFLTVHRHADGAHEFIHVSLHDGKGRRNVLKASVPMTAYTDGSGKQFPTILGPGSVAGVPCVRRHKDLGDGDYWLACVVEDRSFSRHLLFQRLSGSAHVQIKGVDTEMSRFEAEDLQADAEIDLGVFDVPPGIAMRTTVIPSDSVPK
jgi:hypothetical protein